MKYYIGVYVLAIAALIYYGAHFFIESKHFKDACEASGGQALITNTSKLCFKGEALVRV